MTIVIAKKAVKIPVGRKRKAHLFINKKRLYENSINSNRNRNR